MIKTKKKTFRFPFDIDRRYFLGLSILFFILSIKPINTFFFPRLSQKLIEKKVTKHYEQQRESYDKFLHDDGLLKNLITYAVSQKLVEELYNNCWGFRIYDADYHLLCWNNDDYISDIIPYSINKDSSYEWNGEIGVIRKDLKKLGNKNYYLVSQFPLFRNIATNYNYTKSHFVFALCEEKIEENFGYQLNTISNNEDNNNEQKLLKLGNTSLFKITNNNLLESHHDSNGFHLFISCLAFILFGISLHTYFKVSVRRNPRWYFISLVLVVFLIRAFTYFFGWPDNFSEYNLFNPELYYSNAFNKSLGDVFVNACLTFWLLIFFVINVQFKFITKKFKKFKFLFIFLQLTFLSAMSLHTILTIRSLVFDTQLIYNLSSLQYINFENVIGMITFLILFMNFALTAVIVYRYYNHYFNNILYAIAFLIIPILLSYSFMDPKYKLEHIALLIWVICLFIFLNIPKFQTRFDFSSSRLLIWIIFFSFSSSIFIYNYLSKKDRELKKETLTKIMDFENHNIEHELIEIGNKIKSDSIIINLLQNDTKIQKQLVLEHVLNANILSNINNEYQVTLFWNEPSENPFKGKPKVWADNYSKLDPWHFIEGSDSIFLNTNFGSEEYLMKLSLNKNSSALLFISLTTTIKHFANGDFNLVESSFDKLSYLSQNFSIGLFENDTLVNKLGFSSFPFILDKKLLNKIHYGYESSEIFVENENINKKPGRTIVLKSEYNKFYLLSTIFSFTFVVCFLIITLYILGNIIARSNFNWRRFLNLFGLTLRMRIHISILLIEVIAFTIIGLITVRFYKTTAEDKITKLTNSENEKILTKISNIDFNLQDSLNIDNELKLALLDEVENFSKDYFKVYNENGKLIYSTLQLGNFNLFTKQYMNPKVLHYFRNNKIISQTVDENIGKLSFLSQYSLLFYKNNSKKYYLQRLDYSSKLKMQNEISSIISTLVNIYALIFLLSSAIAVLITNRITKSFSRIIEQFSKINLTKINTPLHWPYSDEIGLLVKEYNRTLVKLENSTALLAKNERELAWREMAKQIAHEIKNPLTPMRLSLQSLQNAIKNKVSNVPELTNRMTHTVLEQIEVLSRIATNFSEFAKITDLEARKENLREIIATSTGIYSNSEEAEFLFILPPKHIYVMVDKVKIIRVITNIIQNALQSVDENIVAQISLRTEIPNKNFVRLLVTDNGQGIEEEKAKKIFQPNFTTKTSGSGLGLAMCKDIMLKTGGDIGFRNNPEQGTTFYIDIPVYKEEVKVDEKTEDLDVKIMQNFYGFDSSDEIGEYDDDDEDDD